MNRTYNKFLIISAIVIILSGTYIYFSDGLNVQAATPVSPDSSLVSQNEIDNGGSGMSPLDNNFLQTVTALPTIKIDVSLFTDEAFTRLRDNTVKLDPIEPGRPNPFAPIDKSVSSKTVLQSPITTNEATQITSTKASLSGTVESTTGVTSTYFEYGPTPTLGKVTPQATPSLIGTFITTINGLTPQTLYFYRAVAKVNGKIIYGDVVTFNTN